MKRLIPILFILLLIGACEKKTCWECTIFTEFDYLYNPAMDSFDSETEIICDHNEKQIREFEKQKTFTSESRTGIPAYHYDLKSTCYCMK